MQNNVRGLTDRQIQCLALVANGLTSKKIARELGISPSTVDNHIRAAMAQLGASNRFEAANSITLGKPHEGGRLSRNEKRDGKSRIQHRSIWPALLQLPPFGGERNSLPISQRFLHIIQISLFAIMMFAAITATIAGIVNLFSR